MQKQLDILKNALPHVAEMGWTWAALHAGALDSGLPAPQAELCFPEGLPQALEILSVHFDHEMIAAFEKTNRIELRIHEKVALGLTIRLGLLNDHRPAMRKIARYLLHPARASLLLKLSYKTIDQIWYLAGDQATDYNFYTKRLLLGYVYNSTCLYFVKSRQEALDTTLHFMNNRFAEVAKVPKIKNTLKEGVAKLRATFPNPFRS